MLKRLICLALLACCSAAHADNVSRWVEGTHYFRLEPAQPTSTAGKVEVLEVFSYACPACNLFEPTLNQLKAALPPQARMAYLPAGFNPPEDWPVFQRAFLAAQTLNVAEQSHDAMYDAIWGSGSLATFDKTTGHPLPQDKQPTIADVANFYTRYGVKKQDFLATANSFAVDSLIRRSDAQMLADQVASTPTLIVNGKYRLTPNSAGGYAQTIELVRYLVERELAGAK
ncbi:MAG: thiol:disulfide interchange protein DsbA/DsbL [Nevskia sp.]|nr:thiol:disulfide interchange protein DsbA/DsbL [Nevskia sp.]